MKNEVLKEEMLKEAIRKSMLGKEPTVEFEKIWQESQKLQIKSVGGRKKMNRKKIILVAVIAAILSVTTLYAEYFRRIDDITYTFKSDEEAVGSWTVVDYVKKEGDFKPGEKQWEGGRGHLRFMDLREDGSVSLAIEQEEEVIEFLSILKWTKGHIINEGDKTNSKYIIKKIDGKKYMFYEYKGSGYVFREQKPYLYVLEQGKNIETVKAKGKVDDTNVAFENYDAMKGTWIAIDFVENIEDFYPGHVPLWPELPLKSLTLKDNGAFIEITEFDKEAPSVDVAYWTKGALIRKNARTVSECVIKEIEGGTYMFYQWKEGDYTTIGMKPSYYVLRKQQ